VGGDADEPGEFFDGLALLEAMDDIGHEFTAIGVPAYPEGHGFIPTDALDQALWEKQRFATSMTTQMCFSSDAIVAWLKRQRFKSVTLPAILGIPGVADRRRLLKISARIGVGDSIGFLRKNTAMASRLVRPGSYNPAELLEELGSMLNDPVIDIAGVHIYTFNSCEQTEEWRQQYLESLR
jgi:methylenetetrahydrofolate reductase (NADPH)